MKKVYKVNISTGKGLVKYSVRKKGTTYIWRKEGNMARKSKKNSLNKEDVKRWGMNVLVFSSPALLAFLIAVQNGASMELAKGALMQALIASMIDLLRKYRAA